MSIGNRRVGPDMNEVVAATDRELWTAAVDGDAGAFGALFERHSRAVYNFSFRSTANWATAEDAASDVFLTAWRRRGEVVFTTESGSVLPWLLGVAANQLRNQRRSGRRASAALGRLNAREVQPDHSDETVGRIADEVQMAEVQAVVEQLPDTSATFWRSAPGPGSTMRRRRLRSPCRSGRFARGSRGLAPTCGNSSTRTDMN